MYRGCSMATSFSNVRFHSASNISLCGDCEAERCLSDLEHLTQTLSCALESFIDTSTLSMAVANVEQAVCNLHKWVQEASNEAAKRKMSSGVSQALATVSARKPAIEKAIEQASSDTLPIIIRALDVYDRVLQCHHELVKDQVVEVL
jgi:hypothetical protein